MSKKRKNLKPPWNNIQSAIWIIGIAILFINGNWWPGIMFVVAASLIAETVIQILVPGAVEEEDEPVQLPPTPEPVVKDTPIPSTPVEALKPIYRTDLLPESCPACGARVRENEVRWVSERSADCGYCASPLMRAARS